MLRISDLLKKAIEKHYPFLLMGPSGTGKSTYINKFLKALPL